MLNLAVITQTPRTALPPSWSQFSPEDQPPPESYDLIVIDHQLPAATIADLRSQWQQKSWCMLIHNLDLPNLELTLLTHGLLQLKAQVIYDPLTNLFSRRYMEILLETRWAQQQHVTPTPLLCYSSTWMD